MIIKPLRRLNTCKHYAVDTRRSFTKNLNYLHSIGFNSVLIIFIKIYTFRKSWCFVPTKVENSWNHQHTIICIQNRLLFGLIGSVNDLDTIAYHRYLWDFLHHICSGDNWCGRFGLWLFRSVAVSVCGRSILWPFRFVAIPICGRSGLWPFRSVAIPVCGRFGFWPFRFVAVSVVAVSVCGRYDLLPK